MTAARTMGMRLAGRGVDDTARAAVVGVLDPAARSRDAVLAAAAAHVSAGVDVVEVGPDLGDFPLAEAVGLLRSSFEVAVAVYSDDIDHMRDALDAGASVARCVAPPNHAYLDAVAVRDATIVITDPLGDVSRLAAAAGMATHQVVNETGADGPGDGALVAALGTLPGLVERGHPVAWACEHPGARQDPAAIAWAVQRGARVVITRHGAPAVRIVRTFAAIDEVDAP